MKAYQALFGICIFISASAYSEADAQLLMVAAQINYMNAIESRCNDLMPGYSAEFRSVYAKAKENFLEPAGVTEAVMIEASKIPELEITPLVAKFDRQESEQKKKYCDQALRELKSQAAIDIEALKAQRK